MLLCKYKDFFGKPKTGIHRYRIFDVAIIDVLLTIISAVVLTLVLKIHIVITTIGLFAMGIIMHRLFCVRTTIDKLLF